MYIVVTRHKGHLLVVAAKGRTGRRNRLRGESGRGKSGKRTPPIWGMIQGGSTGGDSDARKCSARHDLTSD